MIETSVFDRTESDHPQISHATYNVVIGLVLCWGFFINWMIVRNVETQWLASINIWVFMVGYFASCLIGVYLFNSSDDPAVSFLGYNFVVIPFGLIINLVVSRYDPTLVADAMQVTALVTIVMMLLGSMYPRFFEAIHTGLVVSLLAVIVIELVLHFVFGKTSTWLDWIVAAIFCGYIGYDWGRANQIPKTLDNAIDSAAAIYMDIINLFLRILRIMGRRR